MRRWFIGYTHYWTPAKKVSDEQWRTFTRHASKVLELAADDGIRLAGSDGHGLPEISATTIVFNGAAPDDYETCAIVRGGRWRFCKTRGDKPYDVVVVAVLCIGETLGILSASSDGTPREWGAGLELARRVMPEAQIPVEVLSGDEP